MNNMKKALFIILIISICLFFVSCHSVTQTKYVMIDGANYKDPKIEAQYVSSDLVEVKFSATFDYYCIPAELTANILLLSNDCVIGETSITLRKSFSEKLEQTFYVGTSNVTLNYHNYDEITVVVNAIYGIHTETK